MSENLDSTSVAELSSMCQQLGQDINQSEMEDWLKDLTNDEIVSSSSWQCSYGGRN